MNGYAHNAVDLDSLFLDPWEIEVLCSRQFPDRGDAHASICPDLLRVEPAAHVECSCRVLLEDPDSAS
jgi:hypothetical protein